MMGANRLHNCTNPHQGSAKKVLCLCSAGLLRSPTVANVLHKTLGYNTRAAGVHKEYALIPVDEVLTTWADEIVCVEEYISKHIPEEHQYKVVCLNLPDVYGYMDKELQEIVLKQYAECTEDE